MSGGVGIGGGKRAFLGIGWRFPLQVTPSGGIALSGYERRIEESIHLILGTAQGERVMLPQYGCGIHDLVFAPDNPSVITAIVDHVRRALVAWEPRIDVLQVTAETEVEQPALLLIRVGYRIRATNALGNLVYPFYITEGR